MNRMCSEPAASAAAPGTAQDARTRPVTNHTAPVDTGSCAAVEQVGSLHAHARAPRSLEHVAATTINTGGSASDAGVAGMAGPAGADRPGDLSRSRLPHARRQEDA